jgi:ribonuclease D
MPREPYLARRDFRRHLVFSGVERRHQGAEKRGMTPEQIEYRAQQAEHLLERYTALERERETAGLYEEALEARRLRLEQEASVIYWRGRATEAA